MTGLELKTLRDSKKLRVQEYADMLGVGRSTLLKYESMEEVPLHIMYATYYLLGHLVVEYVTLERTKKKVVNHIPTPAKVVGEVERNVKQPMKLKGRLKPAVVDTNTYRYE